MSLRLVNGLTGWGRLGFSRNATTGGRWLPIALPFVLASAACSEEKKASPPPAPVVDAGGDVSVAPTSLTTGQAVCKPKTCVDLGVNCGLQADGCGDIIECGSCTLPEVCGGRGPSLCGVPNPSCLPKRCEEINANCGVQADGCGETVNCGTCSAPEICGGGGVPSVCGGGRPTLDGALCVPTKTTCSPGECGPQADGCGGLIQCGGCAAPDTCGGGGVPSVCGRASACVPTTCAKVGANCGPVADGCGNLTEDCGKCTAPEICGGGGVPSVCGTRAFKPDACTPTKTTCDPGDCGSVPNGCGGFVDCTQSQCPAGQVCGGSGGPNRCGACAPKTCAELGVNCGWVADGCGGLADCGGCPSGEVCGGSGVPNRCSRSGTGSDAGTCTNLCLQQVHCTGGATTTVSGRVYAPNGTDPLYNAVIYVPNSAVAPFAKGVSCQQCGTELSGSPLVKAFSAPDGSFKLEDVPVGQNIPFVIQLGKWRKQFKANVTDACKDNPLDPIQTRFPRNHSQGDIPMIAISSGGADSLECALLKIGIDSSEFTNPTGTGRIHFYEGNGGYVSPSSPSAYTELLSTPSTMRKYDLLLLDCEGTENYSSHHGNPPADAGTFPNSSGAYYTQQNLIDYANAGGRIYTSHYGYAWLSNSADSPSYGPVPFSTAQSFSYGSTGSPTYVDTSFPKGQAFAKWLEAVNALSPGTSPPQLNDIYYSGYTSSIDKKISQGWLWNGSLDGGVPIHHTFNTPIGVAEAQQCGRVMYSAFHVTTSGSSTFPGYCGASTFVGSERVLEFMLFDLMACIEPDKTPTCTPRTCQQQGLECGPAGDGCGGKITSCGTCPSGQTCGGVPSKCGVPCTPRSCSSNGTSYCGDLADGCGGLLHCAECAAPLTCGGGGVANVCGAPTCLPRTCQQLGITCGLAGDGCGGKIDCGPCPPNCKQRTCSQAGAQCGLVPDGCGNTLNCGTCPAPQTCGGGGVLYQCGAPSCTPFSCQSLGVTCGKVGDGCGSLLDCGPCPPACKPRTCAEAGADCGQIADNCGGLLECGTCVESEKCGGSGKANLCGKPEFS